MQQSLWSVAGKRIICYTVNEKSIFQCPKSEGMYILWAVALDIHVQDLYSFFVKHEEMSMYVWIFY